MADFKIGDILAYGPDGQECFRLRVEKTRIKDGHQEIYYSRVNWRGDYAAQWGEWELHGDWDLASKVLLGGIRK